MLAVIIIAVIATVVIINMRDLAEWKRYTAIREANEAALGEIWNPLYTGNTTTTANPMHHAIHDKDL